MLDVTSMNVSKADQLNAIDLAGGDLVATITGVRATGDPKQPLIVRLDSWGQPWKPCKSVRRLLAAMWSTDAEVWVGRRLKLYMEPTVIYAGEAVGGVRVREASHIEKPFVIMLPKSSKSRERVTVGVLADVFAHTIEDYCKLHEIEPSAVDAWLASKGKPPLAEVTPDKRDALARYLAGDAARIDEIRAIASGGAVMGSGSSTGGEE